MPKYAVVTEDLIASGSVVAQSVTALAQAHSGVAGTAGACDDTPLASAFADLLNACGTAVASATQAADGLAHSLEAAAVSYAVANSSAYKSLAG